jgi:hypothetical protein
MSGALTEPERSLINERTRAGGERRTSDLLDGNIFIV